MGSGGSTRRVGYCNKSANRLMHVKYRGKTILIWENRRVSLRCGCSEFPLDHVLWGLGPQSHSSLITRPYMKVPVRNIAENCWFNKVVHVENRHEGSISPTSSTTLDVSIRGESFWKGLRMLEVEAIVVWTDG